MLLDQGLPFSVTSASSHGLKQDTNIFKVQTCTVCIRMYSYTCTHTRMQHASVSRTHCIEGCLKHAEGVSTLIIMLQKSVSRPSALVGH